MARAIDEQKRYYDLRAPDYLTGGPSDRRAGAVNGITSSEAAELIDALHPAGDVLELACGPGGFTRELARHARSLTAVDSSPQMLARNASEVALPYVRYIEADVFTWQPPMTYDLVFFGYFLSHVPPALFDVFWRRVRALLTNGGRVAFVDEDDRAAGNDEVRLVGGVPVARRQLADGREFDVVKVFWHPSDLESRLHQLGWDVTVRRVRSRSLFGVGS